MDEFTEFENAQGWHIEIWFDVPAGPMELRPGLRYVNAGSIFEVANDAEAAFMRRHEYRHFWDSRSISGFVLIWISSGLLLPLGPILRFPTGGGDDVTGMKSMHVAGGFGVGLEMRVSRVILVSRAKIRFRRHPIPRLRIPNRPTHLPLRRQPTPQRFYGSDSQLGFKKPNLAV